MPSFFCCSANIAGISASSFSKYVFSWALVSLQLHNFKNGKYLQQSPLSFILATQSTRERKQWECNTYHDALRLRYWGQMFFLSAQKIVYSAPPTKYHPPSNPSEHTHIGPACSLFWRFLYFNCSSCYDFMLQKCILQPLSCYASWASEERTSKSPSLQLRKLQRQ